MRLQEKSLSKLTLADILRKKRKTLGDHLRELGIVTYDRLLKSCTSIGVIAPTEEEFLNAMGNPVTPDISSPMDGILVLNPPPLLEEDLEEVTKTASKKKKKQQDQNID
jgi:hypothetical protein